MTTRPRPSSTLPRPPMNLDPTCVIAESAVLFGVHPIPIGANTVVHPRSQINSTFAAVSIGAGCIISERVWIGLQQEPESSTSGRFAVNLFDNITLEPGAQVEAAQIGEGSVLEAGSVVRVGAALGKYCRVTPLCEVGTNENHEDFTIVFGYNRTRKEKPGLERYRIITHRKQLEVLRNLIPNSLAKWQQPDG